MRFFSSRRRAFQTIFIGTALLAIIGGALYRRLRAQPTSELSQLAPGLSLLSVQTQTPNGPLRFWLVKADAKTYALGLEVADKTDVVKKRSVRNLAAQSQAIVAVNGGFFAYGGAAVGAIKVDNEWHRLPWRNRTALGWSDKGALIGPLRGSLQIELKRGAQSLVQSEAALNGFNLPGQRSAIADGFSLLSARFKPIYTLKTGETAAAITGGNIVGFYANAAQVPLNAQDYLLIARGTMAPLLLPGPNAPDSLNVSIQSVPATWNSFPTIVGAGPRLLSKGAVSTNEVEEEFQPDVIARGPRTAVGWDKDRNWLLLVADGRQEKSVGLTLPESAVLFQQLGAVEAMNLDGGSSTQLVINGDLLNVPSAIDPANPTHPREVQVSNALILKAK